MKKSPKSEFVWESGPSPWTHPSRKVLFKKVRPNAILPAKAHARDVGYDLHACIEHPIMLAKGSWVTIPTGIALHEPWISANRTDVVLEVQVRSRSGWAARHGVWVLNSPATIDSEEFQGELCVILARMYDASDLNQDVIIRPGARIAQLVFSCASVVDFEEVDEFPPSNRGEGGFGSTGGMGR